MTCDTFFFFLRVEQIRGYVPRDSDVIEKPSRRWRGAVQQLADVV